MYIAVHHLDGSDVRRTIMRNCVKFVYDQEHVWFELLNHKNMTKYDQPIMWFDQQILLMFGS